MSNGFAEGDHVDPYKDRTREELLGDIVRLRDELESVKRNTTKLPAKASKVASKPFVFRRWHAALVLMTTGVGFGILAGFLAMPGYESGRNIPIFTVTALMSGLLCFFLGATSLAIAWNKNPLEQWPQPLDEDDDK
jgi:Ni/Fe-hydrogenase subunit HybB-like protein